MASPAPPTTALQRANAWLYLLKLNEGRFSQSKFGIDRLNPVTARVHSSRLHPLSLSAKDAHLLTVTSRKFCLSIRCSSRTMHRTAAKALRLVTRYEQNLTLFRRPIARSYSTASEEPQLEGERRIYSKLQERFNPSQLQVQDVSGGCGTFYAITIASKAFADLPMVQQHRLVNKTLKEDIEGIHGLQVRALLDIPYLLLMK
ncbi:hypothetical protein ACEPAI_5987 [Sanghuangporus weigelae]